MPADGRLSVHYILPARPAVCLPDDSAPGDTGAAAVSARFVGGAPPSGTSYGLGSRLYSGVVRNASGPDGPWVTR